MLNNGLFQVTKISVVLRKALGQITVMRAESECYDKPQNTCEALNSLSTVCV